MKIKDKVLIVEDEQSISNFISMILTANGYDTIIVRSGEEALTMIASHCPDMIVLDLGKVQKLSGFRYLPRQNRENGRIKDYEVYASPKPFKPAK